MRIKQIMVLPIAKKEDYDWIKPFILWLFIVSIAMFFAALTSAYIVKQSELDRLHIVLPSLFGVSTVVILASSLAFQAAYIMAKRNSIRFLIWSLGLAMGLGLGFLILQYLAWGELVRENIYLVGHPSGSFIYVLSGAHAIHVVSGVVFISVVWVQACGYKVHSENMRNIRMCLTYWHFLGGLWLYLYIFLILMNK